MSGDQLSHWRWQTITDDDVTDDDADDIRGVKFSVVASSSLHMALKQIQQQQQNSQRCIARVSLYLSV
jgi:hypothetical protein